VGEPVAAGAGERRENSVALTYGEYLKIDELLALQAPLSAGPEHDELLFIVIHQVYELWFKVVLHELDLLRRALAGDDGPTALAAFKRVLTILKTLVGQIDVLETMTPVSFLSFRHRIETASGFQSLQFRELEFALGQRRAAMIAHYPEGSAARRRLEERLAQPALWDSFLGFLLARGYELAAAIRERDLARPPAESPAVQEVLLRVYREDPPVREVCERMVDLDEGIQEWRYRHVKMVERTIGTKPGTGGSPGAAYLKTTLFQPLFPDLWAIRARL
jgi:tryptophan 2,3-dioxygenase